MSYELTIEPLGTTIDVEEDQTILDAALRAGIWLPHACCHGLCATCKVQVTDGEVEIGNASPFALMDFEREEGKVLEEDASAFGTERSSSSLIFALLQFISSLLLSSFPPLIIILLG